MTNYMLKVSKWGISLPSGYCSCVFMGELEHNLLTKMVTLSNSFNINGAINDSIS